MPRNVRRRRERREKIGIATTGTIVTRDGTGSIMSAAENWTGGRSGIGRGLETARIRKETGTGMVEAAALINPG